MKASSGQPKDSSRQSSLIYSNPSLLNLNAPEQNQGQSERNLKVQEMKQMRIIPESRRQSHTQIGTATFKFNVNKTPIFNKEHPDSEKEALVHLG